MFFVLRNVCSVHRQGFGFKVSAREESEWGVEFRVWD